MPFIAIYTLVETHVLSDLRCVCKSSGHMFTIIMYSVPSMLSEFINDNVQCL